MSDLVHTDDVLSGAEVPPVTIYMKGDRIFEVRDFGAWSTEPLGIFAIGFWKNDEVERNVTLAADQILWMEYHFDAQITDAVEQFIQTSLFDGD